jgi:hypothetical protein
VTEHWIFHPGLDGRRDRARHYHVWVGSAGAVGLVAVNALMFVIFGMIFPIMLTLLFLLVGAAIGYLITLLAR